MSAKRIFYTLLSFGFVALVAAEPHSWADHVCNVSIPTKKDIIVETPVQYAIKVQSMCGILPCTKIRYENRTDQSIKTVIQTVDKLTCCPGYFENRDRRCSPICSDPCEPGDECIAPDKCKCKNPPVGSKPGFTGNYCKRFTCSAENRWGTSCELECPSKCPTNMYCSAATGKCVCEPGWYGYDCMTECVPDQVANNECFFRETPPSVMEPEANLLVDNILTRSRKAEALTLANEDDDIEEVRIVHKSGFDSQAWTASSFLIGVLTVMSLILLVAFLIVKKRYEFVRNELYYASVASVSGNGSSGGSPRSDYSNSTYYTANQSPHSMPGPDGLGKNIADNSSFAAATRNILSGGLSSQIAAGKKILLFSPKTESHLIVSQKSSEQNIYSEVLEKSKTACPDIANRSRAKTPPMAESPKGDDDDHIYQVPRRLSANNTSKVSGGSSIACLLTDVSMLKESDVSIDLGNDNESNIYEELKPKNQGNL